VSPPFAFECTILLLDFLIAIQSERDQKVFTPSTRSCVKTFVRRWGANHIHRTDADLCEKSPPRQEIKPDADRAPAVYGEGNN
jgi:hypothetical protein